MATGWSGVTDPLPQPSGTGIAELETLTARAWRHDRTTGHCPALPKACSS